METKIYSALLDGIRNTTEYKLGHIDLIYYSQHLKVIIIPGKEKKQMNIPSCINIVSSMGLSGYLGVLDGKPAIYIF